MKSKCDILLEYLLGALNARRNICSSYGAEFSGSVAPERGEIDISRGASQRMGYGVGSTVEYGVGGTLGANSVGVRPLALVCVESVRASGTREFEER